jgi:ethanolaminephosphotransferase
MSGTVPNFIDILLNFDSKALVQDNLISALSRAGRTLAFYGDDTWLRLFPTQFARSEGTTSFFVAVCILSVYLCNKLPAH